MNGTDSFSTLNKNTPFSGSTHLIDLIESPIRADSVSSITLTAPNPLSCWKSKHQLALLNHLKQQSLPERCLCCWPYRGVKVAVFAPKGDPPGICNSLVFGKVAVPQTLQQLSIFAAVVRAIEGMMSKPNVSGGLLFVLYLPASRARRNLRLPFLMASPDPPTECAYFNNERLTAQFFHIQKINNFLFHRY